VVNDLDPKDRDIAMVFQNYALYPSKTVAQNMAFPLEMRKVPRAEIQTRVDRAARILSIEHLLQRRPRHLSGGQQQRVALGRALVRDPKVFLMDEPLSNLDAKLRVQMRAEIKRLHQELGTTVIYVTHDQMEAMTMADRMAVMLDGVVQQLGSPDELYARPANRFVAGFIGSPAMNFLRGQVVTDNGHTRVVGDGWQLPLSGATAAKANTTREGAVDVGIRHGHLRLVPEGTPGAVPGRIYTVEPTGDVTYIHVRIGDQLLVASTPEPYRAQTDQPVWLEFEPSHIYLFDAQSGLTL
jgi:multiple sugar transport system ATP-binding protein